MDRLPSPRRSMNSPDMQVKEVKNGRLAMVAFMGFCVQAIVTRDGPLEDLSAHLGNPFGENITTTVLRIGQ